jgi:hypothetical protein
MFNRKVKTFTDMTAKPMIVFFIPSYLLNLEIYELGTAVMLVTYNSRYLWIAHSYLYVFGKKTILARKSHQR